MGQILFGYFLGVLPIFFVLRIFFRIFITPLNRLLNKI